MVSVDGAFVFARTFTYSLWPAASIQMCAPYNRLIDFRASLSFSCLKSIFYRLKYFFFIFVVATFRLFLCSNGISYFVRASSDMPCEFVVNMIQSTPPPPPPSVSFSIATLAFFNQNPFVILFREIFSVCRHSAHHFI